MGASSAPTDTAHQHAGGGCGAHAFSTAGTTPPPAMQATSASPPLNEAPPPHAILEGECDEGKRLRGSRGSWPISAGTLGLCRHNRSYVSKSQPRREAHSDEHNRPLLRTHVVLAEGFAGRAHLIQVTTSFLDINPDRRLAFTLLGQSSEISEHLDTYECTIICDRCAIISFRLDLPSGP